MCALFSVDSYLAICSTSLLCCSLEREKRVAALQQEAMRTYLLSLQQSSLALDAAFPDGALGDGGGAASWGLRPDQTSAMLQLKQLLKLSFGPSSAEELDAAAPHTHVSSPSSSSSASNAPSQPQYVNSGSSGNSRFSSSTSSGSSSNQRPYSAEPYRESNAGNTRFGQSSTGYAAGAPSSSRSGPAAGYQPGYASSSSNDKAYVYPASGSVGGASSGHDSSSSSSRPYGDSGRGAPQWDNRGDNNRGAPSTSRYGGPGGASGYNHPASYSSGSSMNNSFYINSTSGSGAGASNSGGGGGRPGFATSSSGRRDADYPSLYGRDAAGREGGSSSHQSKGYGDRQRQR